MTQDKPKVAVSINGEEQFVDVVESGYHAQFDVDGETVEIAIDYDDEE